ncbi:MAG: DUF3574 domain-containing protein [Desulfovibrio sp.]
MMKKTICIILLLFICGCSANQWNRHEMYFGLSKDGGRAQVTEQEWQSFLKDEISPEFSAGLTVIDGQGFWHEDGRVYDEKSKMVIIYAPASAKDTMDKMTRIADKFKKQHQQQNILVTSSEAEVYFK